MKRNNLKVLAACLSILITLIFVGCARQTMNGAMDNSMEPVMEDTMDTMEEQGMGETMDEMKSDGATEDMGGMKDTMMVPEKEKMMK